MESGSFLELSTEEKIGHHITDRWRDMWLPSKVTSHPVIKVRVEVNSKSYTRRNLTIPSHMKTRNIFMLANSGAKMVVMGTTHAAILGVKEKEYRIIGPPRCLA